MAQDIESIGGVGSYKLDTCVMIKHSVQIACPIVYFNSNRILYILEILQQFYGRQACSNAVCCFVAERYCYVSHGFIVAIVRADPVISACNI